MNKDSKQQIVKLLHKEFGLGLMSLTKIVETLDEAIRTKPILICDNPYQLEMTWIRRHDSSITKKRVEDLEIKDILMDFFEYLKIRGFQNDILSDDFDIESQVDDYLKLH